MKLYSLLKNIKCRVYGSMLVDISGLYHNDKEVKNGGLFFCLSGEKFNGHDFVKNAVNNGAVAIVTEEEFFGLKNITQVIVNNVRKTMSLIACNFYNNPTKKLKIIGVTGTNGKTTTSFMLAGLIESVGKKCAVIGTNGVHYLGKVIDTGMTTPDPINLQKIFSILVKNKIEYVCMEVSAHAIYLKKLEGIIFESMIFTNLTEDHLDFFKTMENYFEAKRGIFKKQYIRNAIINIDDFYGLQLQKSINVSNFTYAIENDAMFKACNLGFAGNKQEFLFNNQKLQTNFIGKFNIYNLTAAIACLIILDLAQNINLQNSIDLLKPVAGRFNQ